MRRVGESAWLLELGGSAQVLTALHALRTRDDGALHELVPGAATLLVMLTPGVAVEEAELRAVEASALTADTPPPLDARAREHRIPVRYDGADLAEVAAHVGLTVADLVTRHAAATYRVAFIGFQPGFAYLAGLPPELHAPRRAAPRTRVPARSVAIGGEWTGVYPLATPGGWNLLGTTDVVPFDAAADPPALLQPGDVVRFEPR